MPEEQKPSFDGLPSISIEADIVNVYCFYTEICALAFKLKRILSRFIQGLIPELVKVERFIPLRDVCF